MKLLDLSLVSPAENLALDEALLDRCEETGDETLRFWESGRTFVVLGYSNRLAEEVHLDRCRQDGVEVLRRVSGGGTVLQGPGCLNYSLALKVRRPGLDTVTGTNHFVMARMRVALARLLKKPVTVEGHTDLAIGSMKFSGNAQRRKRNAVLFHGTLLLDFDLERIEWYLRMPPRQPEYRAGRSHRAFLMNLGEDAGPIKTALAAAWQADKACRAIPREALERLAEEQYGCADWTERF